MSKRASTAHAVHDLIAERWSPVVFEERPLEPAVILGLLEAARWAPSCFNEQPWTYVLGVRGSGKAWQGILDCLAEANQAWARKAPLLMIGVAATTFARNGKPNAHARYDLGQATAQLALQAVSKGLSVHQMAGFSTDAARERFGIPDTHDPVVAIAIGRHGDPEEADEDLAARDAAPRARKPLVSLVVGDRWGEAPDSLR